MAAFFAHYIVTVTSMAAILTTRNWALKKSGKAILWSSLQKSKKFRPSLTKHLAAYADLENNVLKKNANPILNNFD